MHKLFLLIISVFFVGTLCGQLKLHSSGNLSLGTFLDNGSGKIIINDRLASNGGLCFGNGSGLSFKIFRAYSEKDNDYYTFLVRGEGSSSGMIMGEKGNLIYRSTDESYSAILQKSISNTWHSRSYSVEQNDGLTFYVRGDGEVWANDYVSMSDIGLKRDIERIVNPLEKVKMLEGVSYNHINTKMLSEKYSEKSRISSGRQFGLIADEVEKVLPEIVHTNPEGQKGVAYQNIIAILIEAIKEQQEQINDLKKNVNIALMPNYGNNEYSGAVLYQNEPNPASENTDIRIFLNDEIKVATINISNLEGKLLFSDILSDRGESSYNISSGQLEPGIYIYYLIVDNALVDSKRMIITR